MIDPDVEPTWEGQDIDACEAMIATDGLEAFIAEVRAFLWQLLGWRSWPVGVGTIGISVVD